MRLKRAVRVARSRRCRRISPVRWRRSSCEPTPRPAPARSVDAMQTEPEKTYRRWAYAAIAWLVVSFAWHVQMGVMYEDSMGSDDSTAVWLFLSYDALIVLMSVIGVVCVLATVKPWGRPAPSWLVRVPLWIGCAVLTMRGVPGLVENVTTATGLTPRGLLGMEKEAVDTGTWDFWKIMVINGYFFLGAMLLVAATVRSRPSRRQANAT